MLEVVSFIIQESGTIFHLLPYLEEQDFRKTLDYHIDTIMNSIWICNMYNMICNI